MSAAAWCFMAYGVLVTALDFLWAWRCSKLRQERARLALENAYLKDDLASLRAATRRQSRRAGIIDRARG